MCTADSDRPDWERYWSTCSGGCLLLQKHDGQTVCLWGTVISSLKVNSFKWPSVFKGQYLMISNISFYSKQTCIEQPSGCFTNVHWHDIPTLQWYCEFGLLQTLGYHFTKWTEYGYLGFNWYIILSACASIKYQY